jgi:hypothetical protein
VHRYGGKRGAGWPLGCGGVVVEFLVSKLLLDEKPSEEAAGLANAVPWATQGVGKGRRAWIRNVYVKAKRLGNENREAHSVTKAHVGIK